jgi:hypothetical protein
MWYSSLWWNKIYYYYRNIYDGRIWKMFIQLPHVNSIPYSMEKALLWLDAEFGLVSAI